MMHTTATGVAYDDEGSGDLTLLFLPGWCGSRDLFTPLMTGLRDEYRVIAVDWPGHGDSQPHSGGFGFAELVDTAQGVLSHAGVGDVVPVTAAHAGWVGIELHRRLGADRVPALALLDWMVLGAPEPFQAALAQMATPANTRTVVNQITSMWTAHLNLPDLTRYVTAMAAMDDAMWVQAATAIAAEFEQHRSPLAYLASLEEPPRTLHLYAQPNDPEYLAAQHDFTSEHPWFTARRLDAHSHFPTFEVPDPITAEIRRFLARERRPTLT